MKRNVHLKANNHLLKNYVTLTCNSGVKLVDISCLFLKQTMLVEKRLITLQNSAVLIYLMGEAMFLF